MSSTLSEHFEYLTLPGRNDLYRAAIAEQLQPGDTVADLGCGVGVLGVFCLEAGASEVWGIDNSAAIHLAEETMRRSGLGDRYHCIADSTFRAQLPDQVDLLVCDHVGFFGFDYGIVGMLRDARRRFLKPGGKIIPQIIEMKVAAVASEACLELAAGWSNKSVPAQYHWLEESARNVRHIRKFAGDEFISDSATLGAVELGEDTPDMVVMDAMIVARKSGRVDGLAGWFDCSLAPGVRMTNDPHDPGSIQRAQAFLPAQRGFEVEKGDVIEVSVRFRSDDDFISWSIRPPGGAARQKLSTFKSMVMTPADLVEQSNRPLSLTTKGEARAFVLSLVDGERTSEGIIAQVLAEKPELFPSERAIRDFVLDVLKRDCEA